jgi:hypothetical protein
MAFGRSGNSTARLTQQITLTFSPEKLRASGEHIYTFE